MYHEAVTNEIVSRLETAYRVTLHEYTPQEVLEWRERLADVVQPADPPRDLKKRQRYTRPLTEEENAFILNEVLLGKAAFQYWAQRYAYINVEGSGIAPMFPLWESQKLILQEIARLERETFIGERNDGQLIALLKARQLGGSTLAEAMVAHRSTTQDHLFGLLAADVPEQTAYLFDMYERIVFNLPWYMRPLAVEHTKSPGEIKYDGGTNVWSGSGKSTRGVEGQRGELGRGRTVSTFHFTELSTWEETRQIGAAFLPAVPATLRTFGVLESSGRGRHNWWHTFWVNTRAGDTRFTPVFIPWYAERTKYTAPAPPGWSPSASTLSHAKKCEMTGPRWLRRSVSLTRDQLYWYEKTRRAAEAEGQLSDFLENYCADDEEAFQFSGKSVFDVTVIQRILDRRREPAAVCEVGRNIDIQRHWPEGVRTGAR